MAARTAGLYPLKPGWSRTDPQGMTNYDEPIYENVKREYDWDPERCEPLGLTSVGVGRHRG